MPTYEYKCESCRHEFEQYQSIKDKPLKTCPACKKPKLERLIGTGAAVLFKGSGFYQTDYRSESYKKAAAAEKPSTASGSDASSSKEAPKSASTGDSAAAGAPTSSKPPATDATSKRGAKKSPGKTK